MTDAISGKFNYDSLKSTLRKKGVKANEMNSALRQVAVDNHIADIKNLDDKKEIKISESIFNKEQADNQPNINPVQAIGNLFFLNSDNQTPFLTAVKPIDFDDTDKLPEVYNDDEYEVVDYDEFYQFGNNQTKLQTMEYRINQNDNNQTKVKTMEYNFLQDGPQKEGDPNPATPELMQYFAANSPFNQTDNVFAFNSNVSSPFDILNQNMSMAANNAFSFVQPAAKNYSTEADDKDKDREDLLEGAMQMDMDMSGNTFDA